MSYVGSCAVEKVLYVCFVVISIDFGLSPGAPSGWVSAVINLRKFWVGWCCSRVKYALLSTVLWYYTQEGICTHICHLFSHSWHIANYKSDTRLNQLWGVERCAWHTWSCDLECLVVTVWLVMSQISEVSPRWIRAVDMLGSQRNALKGKTNTSLPVRIERFC